MPMPVLMASHDQKCHVTPHFNPYLRNAVVPLMIPLASQDTDAGTRYQMTKKVMLHLILIVWT